MLKVELNIDGLDLFWGEKGYKWPEGDPITSCWEDLYYKIKRGNKTIREGGTTPETIEYVQYEIDSLYGDLGEKMEIEFPGYVEEELNSTNYGIPYKDLPNCGEYKWLFSYDDPESEDFYQIEDMINLPKDENGIYPCYITGFIPVQHLTRKIIEDWFLVYMEKFLDLKEETEFVWVGVPSDESLEKEYKEYIKGIEQHKQNVKEGKKYEMRFLPQALWLMIGKEKVKELVDRGLEYADMHEDTKTFIYHFKDGHTEISGTEIDEGDHFTPPGKNWE